MITAYGKQFFTWICLYYFRWLNDAIYIFHACIISIKFLTRNTDVVCYKNKCIILIFNAIESFVYPSLLQYVSVHVCILYVLLLYLIFNCIYPSTKIDNGQTPKTGKCVVATFIKWNEMTILWNVHNHPEWYKRSQNAYDKTLFLCADVSNIFFYCLQCTLVIFFST